MLDDNISDMKYYRKEGKINRKSKFYKVQKKNILYDDKQALIITIVNMTELAQNMILQKQILEEQNRANSIQNYSSMM